ncbi:MAG: hypothetical protein ACOH2M_04720 [Cypionkella sp.]
MVKMDCHAKVPFIQVAVEVNPQKATVNSPHGHSETGWRRPFVRQNEDSLQPFDFRRFYGWLWYKGKVLIADFQRFRRMFADPAKIERLVWHSFRSFNTSEPFKPFRCLWVKAQGQRRFI